MRKLALSDEILMQIEKPARYIGNELNSVVKDDTSQIRFAMCFPDVYEIGMSHLGIQILYDMFNRREDTWCERVYSPWPDLHKIMKEQNIPLFGLESQEPIKNFDFVGLTLQYEMCYTNILQILDLAQIPLLSADRGDEDPIILGGGPCSYNPEPIADFFDCFYIGEGETQYDTFLNLYKSMRASGQYSRKAFLHEAAKIEGIYVPSLYEVRYKKDDTIAAFTPVYDDIPATIKKQVDMDLTGSVYPEKPVVPFIKATQDRVVLEIQRGCIRGCRFCQAGMIYRPNREKGVKRLKELAQTMLASTGYEEISLSSLSSSDYSDLEELINFLIEECDKKHVNISLPSLRIDAFSLDIMQKVQDIRKSSLTFAPEAGSQRLRNVINKGLTVDNILTGSHDAFVGGWNKVKLYFMMGLPTETLDDVAGIVRLAEKIIDCFFETPNRPKGKMVQISISCATFVPKPFTPFQFEPQVEQEELLKRQEHLLSCIQPRHRKKIKVSWHTYEISRLEAVLARGDRRLSTVIEKAWRSGSKFDSWSECFHYEIWEQAMSECGLDPAFYANRIRAYDEVFPWDHLDYLVDRAFFVRENQKAHDAKTTPHCRSACAGCGINRKLGRNCF